MGYLRVEDQNKRQFRFGGARQGLYEHKPLNKP